MRGELEGELYAGFEKTNRLTEQVATMSRQQRVMMEQVDQDMERLRRSED